MRKQAEPRRVPGERLLPPARCHGSSCLSVTIAESRPGDGARAASGAALHTLVQPSPVPTGLAQASPSP